MRPICQASSAVSFSAATNNARARAFPISRGRRWVPPRPVMSPSAAPRCPNIAFGEATRRRQASAKSEASAHAVTRNCRKYRSGEVFDARGELLTHLRELACGLPFELGNLLQLGAGRKKALVAGDYQWGLLRASSEIFLVSDITQSRVSRLVPSSDTSRSSYTLLTDSSSNPVTDIRFPDLGLMFVARSTPRDGNHPLPTGKFPLQNTRRDALRIRIANCACDPLLSHSVLRGSKPFLGKHVHQSCLRVKDE